MASGISDLMFSYYDLVLLFNWSVSVCVSCAVEFLGPREPSKRNNRSSLRGGADWKPGCFAICCHSMCFFNPRGTTHNAQSGANIGVRGYDTMSERLLWLELGLITFYLVVNCWFMWWRHIWRIASVLRTFIFIHLFFFAHYVNLSLYELWFSVKSSFE